MISRCTLLTGEWLLSDWPILFVIWPTNSSIKSLDTPNRWIEPPHTITTPSHYSLPLTGAPGGSFHDPLPPLTTPTHYPLPPLTIPTHYPHSLSSNPLPPTPTHYHLSSLTTPTPSHYPLPLTGAPGGSFHDPQTYPKPTAGGALSPKVIIRLNNNKQQNKQTNKQTPVNRPTNLCVIRITTL